MRIGNFHLGFINPRAVTIREVVLNPAFEAFHDFEAVSQILGKIEGGLTSVNVYENDGNGLFGLKLEDVQTFMRRNAFAIYLNEMLEGEVFIGVTKDGKLFISEEKTGHSISSTMFDHFGILPSAMTRAAVGHYEKTVGADVEVLSRSGFEGIITPQTNTVDGGFVDDAAVEKIEKKLNGFGLQPGSQKYFVTNQPYQIAQPKNELATLDFTGKQKQTFLTLCDKFGCPKELFAIADNSTYENRRLAKVDFYQNTIFPYLDKILDQVNGINEDITGVPGVFYLAKTEVPEVAYEERNAKIAARQGVDALVRLFEKGLIDRDEVRANIGEFFYLNDEQK